MVTRRARDGMAFGVASVFTCKQRTTNFLVATREHSQELVASDRECNFSSCESRTLVLSSRNA